MRPTSSAPHVTIVVDDSLRSRFWAKVDKRGANECWEWNAHRNPNGYGRMSLTCSTTLVLAPRVSWSLNIGPITPGSIVCHTCDNPSCVNPRHLFLGTHKDNAVDRDAKGHKPPYFKALSERQHCAKAGHPLSGDNIWVSSRGHRICKECKRAASRAFMARKRATTP